MKKLLVFSLTLTLLALTAMPALALNTGLEYGSYTGLGTKDLREGIMAIVNVLFGFLGIIAIIIILIGGFYIMLAGGNSQRTDTGKMAITAGVIGLVIIFISYALASFVINQLIIATGAN